MAKSGGPRKSCVSCGKDIHARTTTCPHCQAGQPIKGKGKKPADAPQTAPDAPGSELQGITDVFDLCKRMGSEKVKALIGLFERAKG